MSTSVVGQSVARVDALDKVTGRAKYTADLKLPGMLYAAFLRSPHAHARIIRIDTSKAEVLPGVKAVNTTAVHLAGTVIEKEKEPAKEPAKEPPKEPAKESGKEPAKEEPEKEPKKEPAKTKEKE